MRSLVNGGCQRWTPRSSPALPPATRWRISRPPLRRHSHSFTISQWSRFLYRLPPSGVSQFHSEHFIHNDAVRSSEYSWLLQLLCTVYCPYSATCFKLIAVYVQILQFHTNNYSDESVCTYAAMRQQFILCVNKDQITVNPIFHIQVHVCVLIVSGYQNHRLPSRPTTESLSCDIILNQITTRDVTDLLRPT